jgi:predicted acetyltransferase
MNVNGLILRELQDGDEAAFLAGVESWRGEDLEWHTFHWKPGMAFADLLEIQRKQRLGLDLAPGRVPASMLYGFVDGTIVGRVSIRHELNDFLRTVGGHMGYAVAPAFRRHGYATTMARLGLDACRSVGLRRILVTAGDSNAPSWRIIEKLGGILENTVEHEGVLKRRYWLDL